MTQLSKRYCSHSLGKFSTGEQPLRTKMHAWTSRPVDWGGGGWGGLGGGSEEPFFGVRVFNPFAPSYRFLPTPSTYLRHEKEKRDRYEERVREVERVAFTPLVFSATGGASKLTTTFLKRLAACMADKSGEAYSTTMSWLRACVAFNLLPSAVACLRTSRCRVSFDTEDLQPGLATGLAGTSNH